MKNNLWGFVKKIFAIIKSLCLICYRRFSAFNKKVKQKPRGIRFLAYTGYVVCLFVIYLILVDINFLWLFGRSPNVREIGNPHMDITSELYSSDGKLIGKYFDVNRTPVKYYEISPKLIKTLVATEDARFYSHHGIDIKASFSVLWYMAKGDKRGGSTITQQLVKNLFKTRSNYSRGLLGYVPLIRVLIYKTKEWINALKIEMLYSKKEILTMYFNTVDFGSNTYGIKTAAKTFFNTTPYKLNYQQCATLVGMLKAPTLYSPILHPQKSLERRNVVFKQMLKYKVIKKHQYDSLLQMPLQVDYNPEENYDGQAPYFRGAVSRYLQDWLKENGYDLYRDGLKIYTTIDSRMQTYGEEAMQEHMKRLQHQFDMHWQGRNPWVDDKGNEIPGFIEDLVRQSAYYKSLARKFAGKPDSVEYYLNHEHKMRVFTWKGERDTTFSFTDSIKYYKHFLHGGFMAMDPETGYIKAWVGDINFNYFKYDHVQQSKRQPGSTFKAFLYTAAMENGFGPCDNMSDVPVSINYTEKGEAKTWSPRNATGNFSGMNMTLKYAFARSVNSIAVQLTKLLGWEKVIEYAHKMGITSALENVPSVAIGSSDVSLFELVDAYCPTINGGYRVEPLLVTKIEDKDGHVLKEFHSSSQQVISTEASYLMTQMLRGGMTEPRATTQALFSYDLFKSKIEFGGKTGTSQHNSDGWFVGVTPKLIGGAWVGGEHRSIHFRTNALGEGCKTALPIFGLFMEKVLHDSHFDYLKVPFPKPDTKISKNFSCHTFYRPDSTRGRRNADSTAGGAATNNNEAEEELVE